MNKNKPYRTNNYPRSVIRSEEHTSSRDELDAITLNRRILAVGMIGLTALGIRMAQGISESEEKEPTPQAQVVQMVDAYIQDPEQNPLPESVEFTEYTLEQGDSPRGIGMKIIQEKSNNNEFTSDDANNAHGTVNLTSDNAFREGGNTLHPGDVLKVAVGDINQDGKQDVVILGATRNNPY